MISRGKMKVEINIMYKKKPCSAMLYQSNFSSPPHTLNTLPHSFDTAERHSTRSWTFFLRGLIHLWHMIEKKNPSCHVTCSTLSDEDERTFPSLLPPSLSTPSLVLPIFAKVRLLKLIIFTSFQVYFHALESGTRTYFHVIEF